jgi:hypothetical protein
MAIRGFKDSSGVEWRVWSTRPSNPSHVEKSLRGGWLTFDSGSERRRFSPIPEGWEIYSPENLERACQAATLVRTSPGHGVIRRTLFGGSEFEG